MNAAHYFMVVVIIMGCSLCFLAVFKNKIRKLYLQQSFLISLMMGSAPEPKPTGKITVEWPVNKLHNKE